MNATLDAIAKRIDHRRLATPDLVTEILREAILSGALKGGESIRQDVIAADLDVSKTPVREALRRLEAEGLVRFYRNRGATVADLSIAEIKEAFEIRIALECLALDLAMATLAPRDIDRARLIVADMEDLDDLSQLGELNWRFHETLYASCRRPILMGMIRNLHRISERYVRLQRILTDSHELSQNQHRDILDALQEQDCANAKRLLAEHMETASQRLVAHLRAKGVGGP